MSPKQSKNNRPGEDREALVFLSMGILSPEDKERVEQSMGKLALPLSTHIYTVDEFVEEIKLTDEIQPLVESKGTRQETGSFAKLKPFEELADREDFVVREHFDEFRERFARQYSLRAAAIAFNGCIDILQNGADQALRMRNEPSVRSFPSLIVRPRIEVGILPLPAHNNTSHRTKELIKYAIQAGSLADLADLLAHEEKIFNATKRHQARQFVYRLARQLSLQVS